MGFCPRCGSSRYRYGKGCGSEAYALIKIKITIKVICIECGLEFEI
jgi:hypothetical protein